MGSEMCIRDRFYDGVVLPVPEAATASLGLLGLAALLMRRRRSC